MYSEYLILMRDLNNFEMLNWILLFKEKLESREMQLKLIKVVKEEKLREQSQNLAKFRGIKLQVKERQLLKHRLSQQARRF